MSLRSSIRRNPLALVLLVTASSAAEAETLSYGVDAGVAESDNVTLVSANKVSQTIAIADADFDVKKQSRLLDLDAKGNFSYLDYLQNAYTSQLIGRFDGLAHFAIIPERVIWVLQDNFGQAALDPFTPTTPSNMENVNYLSTGPDVNFRLGGTSFLNMGARYARAQYATSPYNSNRWFGNLAWGIELSSRSSVSLNADTERVQFENTVVNSDFDRTNAYVRYTIQGARTELSADLGATRITENGSSTSGGLGKVDLTRKISAAAKLKFTAGHTLTDASTSFSNLQSGATGVVGTAPAAQSSNNYTSNFASIGWQYERNRTTFGISARWEKDSYSTEPSLDNTRDGAELSIKRRLSRAFTVDLVGRYYRTDYVHAVVSTAGGSSEYRDGWLAAGLTWRHGRGLEVRLRGEHTSRNASEPGAGYGENRALLTIGYRPEASQDSPKEE
jgi:Surface lipoprotein assembly modifier